MINLTNRPIWLGPRDLEDACGLIGLALSDCIALRKMRFNSINSLGKLFPQRHTSQFDFAFLESAYVLSQSRVTPKTSSLEFIALLTYGNKNAALSARDISELRVALKTLFLLLWKKRLITLPMQFVTAIHADVTQIDNELLEYAKTFKPHPSAPKFYKQFYSYLPRVLMATNWNTPEDFSLLEWADAQRLSILHKNGLLDFNFPMATAPWQKFPSLLIDSFPGRVSYTHDDLKTHSRWVTGHNVKSLSFREFLDSGGINNKRPKKINALKCANKPRTQTNRQKLLLENLVSLAQLQQHDACLQYFKSYMTPKGASSSWADIEGRYPGREAYELTAISKTWGMLIDRYFKRRTRDQGLEEVKPVAGSLRYLQSYLFGYLPWWQDIYQDSRFLTPETPKKFLRGIFVGQLSLDEFEDKPLSLLEFIALKRVRPSTYNSCIRQINDFFAFIESDYSDDEVIAGPSYRNPMSIKSDTMRESRPSKTTKVPFRRELFPIFLLFAYELEAFGISLTNASFENPNSFDEQSFSKGKVFDFSKTMLAPYKPLIHFGEKTYEIKEFPNLFRWFRASMTVDGVRKENILIPNLTSLRALILGLETGLRFVAIRYLDKRTWDKKNPLASKDSSPITNPDEGEYFFKFHVNTDKSKSEAWDALIVYRARRMLLREQEFWGSINGIPPDAEVHYLERMFSRFPPLMPLFRNINSPSPISENHIALSWMRLLTSFQNFTRKELQLEDSLIKVVPKHADPERVDFASDPQFPDTRGSPFCRVSILPVHTPHACRATYATLRMNLLDISVIASNLGHDSQRTTIHYISPLADDVMKMLEKADKAVISDVGRFNKESVIRANSKNSALYQSLQSDKDAAIKNFGMASLMNNWSLTDAEKEADGIKILKNSPMAKIKFLDTHICPVGEFCPKEILLATGGVKRCGTCSIAVVSVDHLPAITAKLNQIAENIRYLKVEKERFIARNEDDLVQKTWESSQLEAQQYIGWSKLQSILLEELQRVRGCYESAESMMYTHAPDIVRKQLSLVTAKENATEMLLTRLVESNAYPSMTSPQVRAIAKKVERQVLAGIDIEKLFHGDAPDEVEIAVRGLAFMMKAKKLPATEIIKRLTINPKLLEKHDE